MKKSLLWIMVVLISLTLMSAFTISGCKKGTAAETTAAETTTVETTSVETTAAETTTAVETTVSTATGNFSIAAFEGGYGVEWIKEAIKVFSAKYPKVTVDFTADPKIHEKLQPMFVAGTPPDVVCLPTFFFDLWGAIFENQILPLENYLNSNAIDKEVKWIDTLDKNTFMAATSDGHIWYLPQFINAMGWWYNKTVWDKNGWVPPKTWDEAYKLFDAMKKAGVAPIANQGIYPLYIRFTYLPTFIARLAGPKKLEACWNLAPNSWTDPEVVKAFAFIKDLSDKYFQEGNLGMNHLQSQAEVMVGKAGMISVGDWFPKEEEQVWPEGAEIRATDYPSFDGSPYPQNVHVSDHNTGAMWVIPAKSKQVDLAVDFLKILYSEQIQKFTVENTGSITVYNGSKDWMPDNKFGRAVKSAFEYYEGDAYVIPQQETLDMWYPQVKQVIDDNILKMFNGKSTPEEVCAAIQKACDDYRADSKNFVHAFSLGLK
ncbi:MAG: extracellular solute-binding protein [Actinobacteria bacterium]|nr:extracellular solute-binding protein [Actinomycetota bacterium]